MLKHVVENFYISNNCSTSRLFPNLVLSSTLRNRRSENTNYSTGTVYCSHIWLQQASTQTGTEKGY